MKTVTLSFLAGKLEDTTDGWSQFYHVKTGEVEQLPDVDNEFADLDDEDEELLERIEESDDYIRLPGQYEIHEYQIMEDFARKKNIPKLYAALKGRGAYRRFKDCCLEMGIRDEYFAFRFMAFIEIARNWCEDHKIPYENE